MVKYFRAKRKQEHCYMMTDRSYMTVNNVDRDVKHKHINKRKQNYINE